MRPFIDPKHPFFSKPWRRWATALIPIAWGLFEFWMGGPFWGILFVAMGVYALNVLILRPPSDT